DEEFPPLGPPSAKPSEENFSPLGSFRLPLHPRLADKDIGRRSSTPKVPPGFTASHAQPTNVALFDSPTPSQASLAAAGASTPHLQEPVIGTGQPTSEAKVTTAGDAQNGKGPGETTKPAAPSSATEAVQGNETAAASSKPESVTTEKTDSAADKEKKVETAKEAKAKKIKEREEKKKERKEKAKEKEKSEEKKAEENAELAKEKEKPVRKASEAHVRQKPIKLDLATGMPVVDHASSKVSSPAPVSAVSASTAIPSRPQTPATTATKTSETPAQPPRQARVLRVVDTPKSSEATTAAQSSAATTASTPAHRLLLQLLRPVPTPRLLLV
ncbi:hypothetical protein KEM55_005585, partial [Ascosphaera atra]